MPTIIVNGKSFTGGHIAIREGVVRVDGENQELADKPIKDVKVKSGEIYTVEVRSA